MFAYDLLGRIIPGRRQGNADSWRQYDDVGNRAEATELEVGKEETVLAGR